MMGTALGQVTQEVPRANLLAMKVKSQSEPSAAVWRALRRLIAGGEAEDVSKEDLAQAALRGGVGALAASLDPSLAPLLASHLEREVFVALHLDRALAVGAEALREAGLQRPVLLKGVATAHQIYENPSYRVGVDVDLLVSEEAFDPTLEALRRAGFEDRITPSFERKHGQRAWEHELAWVSEGGSVSLDVHRALAASARFRVDHEAIIERAVEHPSLPWPLSHPEDTLLHTALHIATNRFTVPLKSWVDLHRLVAHQAVDLERVAARARSWRMATALWAALWVMGRWFESPPPTAIMASIQPAWPARRTLMRRLSHEGGLPVRSGEGSIGSRLLLGPLLSDDLPAACAWATESLRQVKRMASSKNPE